MIEVASRHEHAHEFGHGHTHAHEQAHEHSHARVHAQADQRPPVLALSAGARILRVAPVLAAIWAGVYWALH